MPIIKNTKLSIYNTTQSNDGTNSHGLMIVVK